MSHKIGIIIQARMGSSRLPGKVMRELLGQTVLGVMVEKSKQVKNVDQIVIATSANELDSPLEKVSENHGVECFRGSESDVLSRYLEAGNTFGLDTVIRLTADCPLISVRLMNESLEAYLAYEKYPDYFYIDGYPNGLGAIEIFSRHCLIESEKRATRTEDREHVVTYMINNYEVFKVEIPVVSGLLNRPELRVTLDTSEDFQVISKIAEHFQTLDIEPEKLIKYLDEHPEVRALNKNIKQVQV